MMLQTSAAQAHDEIKALFRSVWDCKDTVSLLDTFNDSVVVSREDIANFNRAIGNTASAVDAAANDQGSIDLATMAGWRPLIRALFANDLQGNLLRLVHLSHGFCLVPSQEQRTPVQPEERIDSQARVTSVQIVAGTGKKIKVEGSLWRYTGSGNKYEWLALTSEFLIRGDFNDYGATFARRSYDATVPLDSPSSMMVGSSPARTSLRDLILNLGAPSRRIVSQHLCSTERYACGCADILPCKVQNLYRVI